MVMIDANHRKTEGRLHLHVPFDTRRKDYRRRQKRGECVKRLTRLRSNFNALAPENLVPDSASSHVSAPNLILPCRGTFHHQLSSSTLSRFPPLKVSEGPG